MRHMKKFEAYHGYGPKKKRVLIEQKKKFIPLLMELTDEADADFGGQRDRWVAMSFIERGDPSETYMEKILDILKKHGVDTSSIEENVVVESVEEDERLTVKGFEDFLTKVEGLDLKHVDNIISYLVSKGVSFEDEDEDDGDDTPIFPGYNLN
jgi:hypothetical protein